MTNVCLQWFRLSIKYIDGLPTKLVVGQEDNVIGP